MTNSLRAGTGTGFGARFAWRAGLARTARFLGPGSGLGSAGTRAGPGSGPGTPRAGTGSGSGSVALLFVQFDPTSVKVLSVKLVQRVLHIVP